MAGVGVWGARVTYDFSAQVLLKFRNPRLHRTLLTWSSNVDEVKMQRVVLRRVIVRLTTRLLAVGFETWYTNVVEIKRQLAAVEAALLRWRAWGVADAFENWMEAVLRSRSRATFVQCMLVRMKRCQEEERRERRDALLPAVLSRWLNRRKQKAFRRWEDAKHDLQRLRTICTKNLARWGNLQMSMAFDHWFDNAYVLRRLRRVVARWICMQKSQVWDRWLTNAHEQKRLRAVGLKVVARWVKGTLSGAFHAWSFGVFDAKQSGEFASFFVQR